MSFLFRPSALQGSFLFKPSPNQSSFLFNNTNSEFILNSNSVGAKGDKGDIGLTGVVSASVPLIYDPMLRTMSIEPEYYAYFVHTHSIAQVLGLQTALDGKQPTGDYATNTALTNGLATKQPVGDYSTNSYVNATFQPLAGMSAYLTSATASATYYPLTNPTGYITSSALSPYLLSATASTTYQLIGDYATNSSLNAGLATKQPVGDYATGTELADGLLTKANVLHTHTIQQVDGLEDELDGKQPVGNYATNEGLVGGLLTKADVIHTHDASAIVSGVIDISHIPVIPSQVQVFANEPDITQLTIAEQNAVTGAGVVVVLSNGERWIYKGDGSKIEYASYVQLSDLTPDWNSIENKPDTFPPSAHTHPISQVVGLQTALDGKSPLFDQSLNTTNSPHFANVTTSSVTIEDTGNNLIIDVTGITFPDATQQTTAGVSPSYVAGELVHYLPLTGGTMVGSVYFNTSGITNAEGGSWGFGVASTATPANFSKIEYNLIQTADATQQSSITPNGFTVSEPASNRSLVLDYNQIAITEVGTGGTESVILSKTGLIFNNQSGTQTQFINGGIVFPDNTVQETAWTGSYNPFNQTLNTTDSATFGSLKLGTLIDLNSAQGLIISDGVGYIQVEATGITFPDSTIQTTAWTGSYNPFDQSLNTTDDVGFSSVSKTNPSAGTYYLSVLGANYSPVLRILSPSGLGTEVNVNGITFSDGTTQTTSGAILRPTDESKSWLATWSAIHSQFETTEATTSGQLVLQNGGLSQIRYDAYGSIDGSPEIVVTNTGDVLGATIVHTSGIRFPDGTLQVTAASGGSVAEVYVYNDAIADDIPSGRAVSLSPNYGGLDIPVVKIVDASELSNNPVGFAKTTIPAQSYGYVIVAGEASGIDTSLIPVGQPVYLTSGGVYGGVGSSPPVGSSYRTTELGFCLVSSTDGKVMVGRKSATKFEELTGVNVGGVGEGQLLISDMYGNWSGTPASNFVPTNNPTFTGTVTIPAGASISGYAPLASPAFTGNPTAPTQPLGDNDTSVATTAFVSEAIIANGINIQQFGSSTTFGSYTWTKPANAKVIELYLFGGGGGGGGGGRFASNANRGGGGGGAGGTVSVYRLIASEVNESITGSVGRGGIAVAGKTTDNTSGSVGNAGLESTFGSYRSAGGASGGAGTTAVGGAAGTARTGYHYGSAIPSTVGGAGTINNATGGAGVGSAVVLVGVGGGGGGGAAAGGTATANGGLGGARIGGGVAVSGYISINGGSTGVAGTDAPISLMCGSGGGGGRFTSNANALDGGAGGYPSAGGGGGGASDNGFTAGGGGAGGHGKVIVITYF